MDVANGPGIRVSLFVSGGADPVMTGELVLLA